MSCYQMYDYQMYDSISSSLYFILKIEMSKSKFFHLGFNIIGPKDFADIYVVRSSCISRGLFMLRTNCVGTYM